jgi:hypothetical protein
MYSEKNEVWVELTARFDSGTPDNWMTKEVVDLLDHAIVTVPFEQYQTFTGEVMGSSELVRSVLWHGDSASTRSRSTDFRVIRKPAPFEVLFGSDFLFSQSVYSFNEPNLILTKLKETPGMLKLRATTLSSVIEEHKTDSIMLQRTSWLGNATEL